MSVRIAMARADENTESGAFAGTGRGRPVRVLATTHTPTRRASVRGPRTRLRRAGASAAVAFGAAGPPGAGPLGPFPLPFFGVPLGADASSRSANSSSGVISGRSSGMSFLKTSRSSSVMPSSSSEGSSGSL
jgi:hypothetical protein